MTGDRTGGGFLGLMAQGRSRNLLAAGASAITVIGLVAVVAFALSGGNDPNGAAGPPEVFIPAQAQGGQSSDDGKTTSTQPLAGSSGAATATTVAAGEPTTTLTPTDTGQTVAVPDIVGLFHLTASVRLGDVGVEYQKEAVCEDENQKERVLSQTPAPGTVVEVGSIVNFTYQYSSPCGPMPDLVGLTEQEARTAWAAAGFVPQFLAFPDSQRRCHDETFGKGLVWWTTGVPGELEPLQFAHRSASINEGC
jgi:hypothetical protein